jgi:hypothetical protein
VGQQRFVREFDVAVVGVGQQSLRAQRVDQCAERCIGAQALNIGGAACRQFVDDRRQLGEQALAGVGQRRVASDPPVDRREGLLDHFLQAAHVAVPLERQALDRVAPRKQLRQRQGQQRQRAGHVAGRRQQLRRAARAGPRRRWPRRDER